MRPLVEVGVRAEIIAVRLQSVNLPSYECMWVLAIASKDPDQGWGVPTKKWVMAIMKEYGFRAKPRWLERFTHARSLFCEYTASSDANQRYNCYSQSSWNSIVVYYPSHSVDTTKDSLPRESHEGCFEVYFGSRR